MRGQQLRRAHPPGIRAFGPIAIGPGMSVLRANVPDSRHSPVDVGLYRGQLIEMSRRAAADMLGVTVIMIDHLVGAGALKESDKKAMRGRHLLLVDPAWSSVDVHDDWVRDQPMPVHHADFAQFEIVRWSCCLPEDHPYPDKLLEGLFQKLLEIGNFTEAEARVCLSLNKARWAVIKSWLNARLGKFCLNRSRSANVTLEMLRLSLPGILRTAPRTCFEPLVPNSGGTGEDRREGEDDVCEQGERPDDGLNCHINHGREAPPEKTRRLLWGMNELYMTAALYALIAAPALRRSAVLSAHVAVIGKVEAIMRIHAPDAEWTAELYVSAFRAYAIDKTIMPNDPAAARWQTVLKFRIVIANIHIYLRQQGRPFRSQVLPLVVPRIKLPFAFRKEMHDIYGALRIAGREERKRVSHKAMNELDMIIDAARNRRDEMRTLGDAVRGEIDAFGDDEASREFAVKLPVLDGRGSLAGGEQKKWLRVWRSNDALISLGREPLEDGRLCVPRRRREGTPPIVRPKFIVEVLDTLPVGTSATREPWMIELDRLGVFACFGKARPESKEARHRAIVDRGLPGYSTPAGGTLNFDIWRGHIRRFGLEVGRHFAPIEQQEYGIRLAFHALDCVNQSYNRAHEVRQQVRNGWRKLDLGPELLARQNEEWFRQDVIGKVPGWRDLADMAPVPIGIRETSYLEAIAITELHKRHAGLKRFPTMAAPSDFKWKCGPGQYVFSSFGRALELTHLQIPLWYLLDGWDDYTLHDFRHAEAEDAALDGYSAKLIAFLLGQQDIDNALYYSKLDKWAQDVVDRENLRRREEAQNLRAIEMGGA